MHIARLRGLIRLFAIANNRDSQKKPSNNNKNNEKTTSKIQYHLISHFVNCVERYNFIHFFLCVSFCPSIQYSYINRLLSEGIVNVIMITSNRHLKGLVIGVFCSAIRHLAMSYLPAAESTSGRWDECGCGVVRGKRRTVAVMRILGVNRNRWAAAVEKKEEEELPMCPGTETAERAIHSSRAISQTKCKSMGDGWMGSCGYLSPFSFSIWYI